jgi:hypothetical protein
MKQRNQGWRFLNLRVQINRHPWWKEEWGLLRGWQWVLLTLFTLGINWFPFMM